MGGKKATTTSKVSIPPEVLARYNAVNAQASKAAETPYEAFGNSPSDYVAQLNAQQYAGFNDINATAGSYQPYMTQATSATQAGMGPAYAGIDNYMSPYIKNVADTTGAMLKQQYEQAQSGALGTAASSGAFGGDRAGIAAANMQQQNQMGYGNTMANIYNQGYTQALGASQADLARQLQGGAQMAELGAQSQQLGLQGAQAKIAAGTMQQQTEQAGKDAMIEQFMQEKGYPFQVAQYLANIAMGTGAASGSTTSTTTPRNWLGFASGGGVSGYADGGGVAGPRTYSQGQIGGQGYVPAGDLPVGQLMVADPPQQQQDDKTGEIIQLIASTMGAKRGGAIDQRHGYALDGGVSYPALNTEELRREQEIRKQLAVGTGNVDNPNKDALMRAPLNPANMGVAGRQAPQMVSPTGVAAIPDAPTSSQRPMPRPEGLGAAGTTAPVNTTVSGPAPTGVVAPAAPTPTGWDTFGPAVSKRESGGDPNALLGFANREGGQFAGTNLTGMTVDQAIDFARVGGDYANYSKTQTPDGRVATPMGEYQIVGTTLADAKRAMGLTGNELMTRELQEQIAKHLYNTRGESPWAASSGVDGGLNTSMSTMGDPQYEGGVKPYEDRNIIGKFFHNRDGSLNSNAIMSLLGGLAKGAEAQTISPLGGILSGLGGGMETYKQLLKQTPEVTKANIENTDALQTAYLRAQQLSGYTGTIDEFAKSQGWANNPFGGTTGPAPTQDGMFGAPFDFAGNGMRTKIMLDGREVYAGQSLAWLQSYKNWLNSQSLTRLVDPNLVSSIDTAIEAAKAGNGQISDTSGNVFTDPAVRSGTFGAGQLISSAERTQQILADISTGASRTQAEDQKLGELSHAVVGMGDTGPISSVLMPFKQLAYELNLADRNDTSISSQEILRKGLAGDALTQLQAMGGDVATQSFLQQQANATFSDAMTKPAIAEILAVRSGINEYNKAFYAYAKELKRTDPNADLYQAELDFKAQNPLSKYVEQQRPIYKEAILNPPVPPVPAGADPELWASDPQYREDWNN